MNDTHVESEQREAYWQATRAQLKSAQNRADFFTVLGLAAIGALLWLDHEPGDGFTARSLVGIAMALVVICAPLWFVTRRRRQISAERGLTCRHCGAVPHDTEISAVAGSRRCQRCDRPLE